MDIRYSPKSKDLAEVVYFPAESVEHRPLLISILSNYLGETIATPFKRHVLLKTGKKPKAEKADGD